MPLVFSILLALLGAILGLRAVAWRRRRHISHGRYRSLAICLNAASIAVGVALVASGLIAHMDATPEASPAQSAPAETPQPQEDRTDELNALFAEAEEGSFIDLSDQSFLVDGYVILPQRSNVTVDANGSEFHGRAVFLSVNAREFTWTGGTFIGDGTDATRLTFNVFRATDAAFLEMTFRSAISFGNHAFDLLGVENLVIDGLTVEGYGDHMNFDKLSPHSLYAEAVQIDYAHEAGVGNSTTTDLITELGGQFDGRPTSQLQLRNSAFTPTYDADGALSTWAPSPIGEHAATPSLDRPSDIEIRGNTFVDPIPLPGTPKEGLSGALHFGSIERLELSGNQFKSSPGQARSSWIQLGVPEHLDQYADSAPQAVRIAGNTFAGATPTRSYIEVHGVACGILDLDHNDVSRPSGDTAPLCITGKP